MLQPKEKLIAVYLRDHPNSSASAILRDGAIGVAAVVRKYDPVVVAKTLDLLPIAFLSEALLPVDDATVSSIANELRLSTTAAILRKWKADLHNEKVESILGLMMPGVAKNIKRLISYSGQAVGSLMNPAPFSVVPEDLVKDVLSILGKRKDRYGRYVYVVNAETKLVGVIPFKEIFYADKQNVISKIMTPDVFCFDCNEQVSSVYKSTQWIKWDAIPIVNSRKELLGVLKFSDLENYVSPKDATIEIKDELTKTSEAVGEVLQIGMSATISALGLIGNKR